jgi:hypothetical protein
MFISRHQTAEQNDNMKVAIKLFVFCKTADYAQYC